MPLYEYQCDGKCGQRFERIQKFSDPPAEKCPNCGGPCHKLFSSPAIQFKGSGWYITDYAKKDQVSSGKKPEAGTSGSAESANSKDSKDSKESKPSTEKSDKPAEKKPATDTTKNS
ncbi:MAG TPA: FmdB family zinc ribbon protein [Vicinamibacterales bacterium]|nr:FmdB family zinc ribbon protein [Vicinamibacterales bacterium]